MASLDQCFIWRLLRRSSRGYVAARLIYTQDASQSECMLLADSLQLRGYTVPILSQILWKVENDMVIIE